MEEELLTLRRQREALPDATKRFTLNASADAHERNRVLEAASRRIAYRASSKCPGCERKFRQNQTIHGKYQEITRRRIILEDGGLQAARRSHRCAA
eukprot:762422-Hanusia_phi.AAC.4